MQRREKRILSQRSPSVPQDPSACRLRAKGCTARTDTRAQPGQERSLPIPLPRKKSVVPTPALRRAGKQGEALSEKTKHAEYFCAGL